MTIDYDELANEARELIDEFGVFGYVKLVQNTGTHDPLTGEVSAGTIAVDLHAVDLEIKSKLVDGTRILASDRMVIMSNDVAPKMSDDILIGNNTHKIIEIMPISPAGTPVTYEVVCRG